VEDPCGERNPAAEVSGMSIVGIGAKKQNKTARRENVLGNQKGSTQNVNLEGIPLKNLRERYFLVLFEDAEKALLDPRQPGGRRGVGAYGDR
jgi:hypothetical protein